MTANSRVLRVSLAVLSVLALECAFVGYAFGANALRLVGLFVFCVVGIGSAPWQLNARLGTYERLALTFVTSLSVMTLVPLAMIGLDAWHPTAAFILVVAACLPMHLLGLRNLAVEASRSPRSWPSKHLPLTATKADAWGIVASGLPAVVPAVIGAELALLAAFTHRHLEPEYYGFLGNIGVSWFVGVLFLLGAIAFSGRREHSHAIPVFLLVLVLTLTPALTYDTPRAQAAAKHIDFVIQIQSLHELNSSVPAYNAWAGFFAMIAWLCDITGITDPLRLATVWPALLGFFRVIALRYLAGQLLSTSQQCWAAVTLAVLADSISADYFSPQSVGFVVGLIAYSIALSRNPYALRLPALLLTGVFLAVSHQLSPYVVGAVLVVLVAFRQIRPWWTPALVLGPAIVWTTLHWSAAREFISISALGRVGNFTPPKTVGAPGLERLPVVPQTVAALLAGIAVVGVLAAITLLRHRREVRYWALACCPGVGLALVAVNPYGQEGIFRAALFGLPWLALLAGMMFAPGAILTRVSLFAATCVLTATFLVSSFGLDAINVIRPADFRAVRTFQHQGGPRPPYPYYLYLLNDGDQPTSPEVEGGMHFIWSKEEAFRPSEDLSILTRRFLRHTEPSPVVNLFALWSPAGAEFERAYALRAPDRSAALRDSFRAAPFWSVIYAADGTYLFKFRPERYPSRRG